MKYLVVIPALLLLASCAQKPVKPSGLTDIFDKVMVEQYLHTAGNKADADKYYKEGEQKLRKDKQPDQAITSFTSSIKAYPTARVYFELGNAYMNAKRYDEAIKAYEIAELMDYKPLSKLLYNTACAHALSDDKRYLAGNYLEYAIESGYSNANHITNDPDLKDIQQGFAYDDSYIDAMSGVEDPAEVLWQRFKKCFATIVLPLTIDKQSDAKLHSSPGLSYKYAKYISEMQSRARFSREGGDSFYGFASIADNNNYSAMVYATRSEMDEVFPGNYWLISFDPKGKMIDIMNIAGQKYGTSLSKVCTINEDLSFTVKTFQNNYQKPPEKDGYYENPLVSTNLTATKDYKIDEAGKFVEVAPRIGMK